MPEPWATRLELEGDGNVLVDEADLWPGGQFVTTHLIVRTEYLEENPDVVKALLEGVVRAIDFANDDADKAKAVGRTAASKPSPARPWLTPPSTAPGTT